jgi:aspartyl-tRNA(Asn)/glutamyl-tRNA(Gln) amidotransferase subunit A
VADDFCEIAIGSDTGGSVRIPSALCGVTGFKPSRQRVPTTGVFPLSFTLDSIGPMAKTVADCAKADAVMAGEAYEPLEPAPLAGLRVGVAQGLPLENLDDIVGKRFPAALDRLEKAGCRLTAEKLPLLERMAEVNRKGGILPAEAFAIHRDRLDRRGADIDPNVRLRLERARNMSAVDYIDTHQTRAELARAMDARLVDLDVLVMPTTPMVAPRLADLASPEVFARQNAMVLRNTSMWNFFDCCALSLPLPREGALPTGFMLVARNGHDRRLLRIAAAAERALSG